MIDIRVTRNTGGRITAIRARGHAGFAEYGEDIICSAVTAVLTTAMAALEDLLHVKHKRVLEEGDVGLELKEAETLDSESAKMTNLILESCALGLKQIEYSYGNEYLAVKDPQS